MTVLKLLSLLNLGKKYHEKKRVHRSGYSNLMYLHLLQLLLPSSSIFLYCTSRFLTFDTVDIFVVVVVDFLALWDVCSMLAINSLYSYSVFPVTKIFSIHGQTSSEKQIDSKKWTPAIIILC